MSDIRERSKYLAITILVGGKSSRFGTDKGLFQILGKPLVSYELEILKQLDYDIFLVAHSKEQVQNYLEKINFSNVMAFIIDNYLHEDNKRIKTPMIGLYSAFKELNKLNYQKTLVLPCDTPLIQKSTIKLLIEESNEYDCIIPRWNNGFLEPLLAIYPIKKALKRSIKLVKNGDYKLTNLLVKNWRIKCISIENSIKPIDPRLKSFININEQSELEIINTILEQSEY